MHPARWLLMLYHDEDFQNRRKHEPRPSEGRISCAHHRQGRETVSVTDARQIYYIEGNIFCKDCTHKDSCEPQFWFHLQSSTKKRDRDMKKSYKHNHLSDRICEKKSCNTRLKKRRVEEHNDTVCYKCWLKSQLRLGRWNNYTGKLRRAGLINRQQADTQIKKQHPAGTCPA